MSKTCFEQPRVHPQFYVKKTYHKTACTSLPEDEKWLFETCRRHCN